MKLTIIRDMGLVHVDGRGHDELDLSSVPVEVHAVQWDGTSGEIEYVSNDVPNDMITSLPSWAQAIANERKAVVDAEIAEEEKTKAERIAYENSAEGKANSARAQRDALIAETDWWASSDLVMTAEQVAYRQALRDITSQKNFPENINWPVKP